MAKIETKKEISRPKQKNAKRVADKGEAKVKIAKKEKAEAKVVKKAEKKSAVIVKKKTISAGKKQAVSAKENGKGVKEVKSAETATPENKIEKRSGGLKAEKKYFAKWKERDFVRSGGETFFYYVSFFATLVTMIWFFMEGNLLSFMTFGVLLVVIVFELKAESHEVEYQIDIDGILIDGKLYKFDEMDSFQIVEVKGRNVIKLRLKNSIFPMRELYLNENQDLKYMQAVMEYFLPEKRQDDMLFNFKNENSLTQEEAINKKVDEYLKGKF